MTHNIQLGINVDDDSIRNGVEQSAIHQIQKALFGYIIRNQYGSYKFSEDFKRDYLNRFFEHILEDTDLKKQIAEMTTDIVAERLLRSPKFRELIKAKLEDDGGR